MKIVVGLGNPGPQYVGTRHNIGFDTVDHLAVMLGWVSADDGFSRRARTKFDGLALDGQFSLPAGERERLLLLKPMVFMNCSGRSVQQAMAFYQVTPGDIMVVLDDLALPCGRIRLRPGGSDGGHNGLRDIQQSIGTDRYPRLRLGIDPPPQFVPQRDYVLGKFSGEQRKLLKPAVERAASAILCWIESGIESAMNRFNAEPKSGDAGGASGTAGAKPDK
jgi:PTH1 family peptidyl-tRNA hydrolase